MSVKEICHYAGNNRTAYKKRKKEHIWWTTTLFPQYRRCKYYFEIVSGDETVFLFEDGFYTEEEIRLVRIKFIAEMAN